MPWQVSLSPLSLYIGFEWKIGHTGSVLLPPVIHLESWFFLFDLCFGMQFVFWFFLLSDLFGLNPWNRLKMHKDWGFLSRIVVFLNVCGFWIDCLWDFRFQDLFDFRGFWCLSFGFLMETLPFICRDFKIVRILLVFWVFKLWVLWVGDREFGSLLNSLELCLNFIQQLIFFAIELELLWLNLYTSLILILIAQH